MSGGYGNQLMPWDNGPSPMANIHLIADDQRRSQELMRDHHHQAQAQAQHDQEQQRMHAQQQHQADVAGVLRRNQACLACRRRKLKCDAIRPHCSTCVRSHKHMMKSAPTTNPVLSCDYDDGTGGHEVTGHIETPSPVDDDGDAPRKKRKAPATEPKRKKDGEAERLKKRIEELEAKLANASPDQAQSSRSARPSVATQHLPRQAEATAQSPTSFLDILSAAATVHAPGTTRQGSGGLRAGVTGTAMMNGATGTFVPAPPAESPNYHTGFTPAFTYSDVPQPGDMRPPPIHHASSGSTISIGQTEPSISPFNQSASSSGPSDPIPLTPSGIFNFSPGPPGPVDYESMLRPDKNGFIQPSTRTQGSWVGIETVDTYIAAAQAKASQFTNIPNDAQIPIDPALDPTYVPRPREVPMPTYSQPFEEDIQQQMLMDLFWPGWPPGLPEPHIVNELIDVFFESVPSLPRMMLRSRFMTRMTLPPTHSNFPHPALLHAICAIASNWCAPSVYEKSTVARTLNGTGGKSVDFSTWQSGLAKEAVHDGLNTGDRMLDVVRSMMILSRLFIDDTRMLECWAFHGLVARMILPLGLNVRSAELSLKSVMLPPPQDAIEREERRGAMWFAFYHDTVSSAASGWGGSIALDELTLPLPCSFKDFQSGAKDIPSNPQDAESSDLFTNHPVVDPFVLCIKASILMNRATRFARKWKNRHMKEDDDFAGMSRPDFRELANNIACFQMSFPHDLRSPCKMDSKRALDIDLIVAHMLPHAAIILLYEPFADVSDSSDASARRILSAAQAMVGIVQQLAAAFNEGSSNFSNVMHSAASVCLVTAGRTCLLFYRNALNVNDNVLATSLKSDIEMIRMALEQFGQRFKIGHHHAQLISYFLDRATYPTYEKLVAHYPDHPRPGAPALHPQADFGICVSNALNIKRGFWRIRRDQGHTGFASAGVSPFGSTPDSLNGNQGMSGAYSGARIDTESPQGPWSGMRSASGSASHTTTLADLPGGSGPRLGVDDGEADVGAWLPHIGVSQAKAPDNNISPPSADMPSGAPTEWEKLFLPKIEVEQPSADLYAGAAKRMEVQPSGQRDIFGSNPKSSEPYAAGVRMQLPNDMPPLTEAVGATKGPTGKGTKGPLVAESAAWFMAAEPAGFRGPRL